MVLLLYSPKKEEKNEGNKRERERVDEDVEIQDKVIEYKMLAWHLPLVSHPPYDSG